MSRWRTQWDLTVTAGNPADYAEAVAKLKADAANRLAEYGEEWTITESPLTATVNARVVQFVDNLDAAG